MTLHSHVGGYMLRRMLFTTSMIVALLSVSAYPAPVQYKVDPAHASVVFKINHLGFSYVYGLFTDISGRFVWDEKSVGKSSIFIVVKTESVNTGVPKRDDHLRGPDFLNVKAFPEIRLTSKSIRSLGNGNYEVVAQLDMNGVSKDVTFNFHHMKSGKDPWGKMRTGGEAAFKVKRTDFGMKYMSGPGEIGDDVELMIGLEAVK